MEEIQLAGCKCKGFPRLPAVCRRHLQAFPLEPGLGPMVAFSLYFRANLERVLP
jgi:hypothetical protein